MSSSSGPPMLTLTLDAASAELVAHLLILGMEGDAAASVRAGRWWCLARELDTKLPDTDPAKVPHMRNHQAREKRANELRGVIDAWLGTLPQEAREAARAAWHGGEE